MKKMIAMMLALLMVLSFAACGAKEEEAPAPAPEAPAAGRSVEEIPTVEPPQDEPSAEE